MRIHILFNVPSSSTLESGRSQSLDQSDHANLRLRLLVDVSLRGPQVRVTGELLDIPQRPPDRRYLPSRVGDESPPPAVTGAADEADVPVPALEHVDDRLRRGGLRSFRLD